MQWEKKPTIAPDLPGYQERLRRRLAFDGQNLLGSVTGIWCHLKKPTLNDLFSTIEHKMLVLHNCTHNVGHNFFL